MIDGPVALRAIILECMLHHLGAVLPAQGHCVICAERVHDVEIVGNFLRLSQRCP